MKRQRRRGGNIGTRWEEEMRMEDKKREDERNTAGIRVETEGGGDVAVK